MPPEPVRVTVIRKPAPWENHWYLGFVYVHEELRFATSGPTQQDVENQCKQWIRKKGGENALANQSNTG